MSYFVEWVAAQRNHALVVGAGPVAAQKIRGLLDAGVGVRVVAPEVAEEVERSEGDFVRLDRREVVESDLDGVGLVIVATSQPELNRTIAGWARARRVPVNVVDDPELCDFFVPAVARRGPLALAVGTGGKSPLLAAQARRWVEALLPPDTSLVAELFARARALGHRGLARRSRLLRALADPGVGRLVDRGDLAGAGSRVDGILRLDEEVFAPGSVCIVGAGPGAAALLTLRAVDRIQRADVVLHDALVSEQILSHVLPGARIVDVGRRCAQPENVALIPISKILVHEARSGARVVRLHAGDPMVFGRGGEEVEALTSAGVPFEVIPGVSSVLASAAAAAIPLTHRGESRGFSVRTGHTRDGYTRGELGAEEETVVVLMGLGAIEGILSAFMAEGRSPTTPALAVAAASLPSERVVVGELGTLAEQVREVGLESPVTVIVGRVAGRARVASPAVDALGA
ncbi:MAG: uroporphyrinogen-III C-methyltransferase [Deltaproteobacteria bacterium]|nr:uroporphyrinogen-III C-methyltransferase [Deltaproteobacteria bacterium]